MGRLEYDDSAFVYFGIGMGSVFLIPFTLHLLYQVYGAVFGTTNVPSVKPRTKLEREKFEKLEKENTGIHTLLNRSFYIKVGIIVFGWLFVFYLYTQTGASNIQQFNPWEILGLEHDAADNLVRKEYRKLARLYHPDRNLNKSPDERAYAAMMFDKIRKAHEILTDEKARKNYEMTGSPDGSTSMEVSIGLPKFLLEKRNHNLVLVVYLLLLVVVTPVGVWNWYGNSKLFGDKLVLNDSYGIFSQLLTKNTDLKWIPHVFALSAEFRRLPPVSKEDAKLLEDLEKKMRDNNRMFDPSPLAQNFFKRWPTCLRANVLIHAYLNRETASLSPALKRDLDFMLHKAKLLIEAMSDCAKLQGRLPLIRDMLLFEQYMTQALWVMDSPLQQLPHIGAYQVKEAFANKIKNVSQFIEAKPDASGRKKGCSDLSDEECKEIENVEKLMPNVELRVTIGVVSHENPDGSLEFEPEACEGDIMTAYFELERKHELGPVHAPFLPYTKEEEWIILFCRELDGKVMANVSLKGSGKILREKIQFPSRGFLKPDKVFKFDFHLFSTSYIGFDTMVTEKVRIYKEGHIQLPEMHPDDIALDNEPTLFEEAFGKKEVSDDSDFADSDDEDGTNKTQQQTTVRRRKQGSGGKDDLALSDDEDYDNITEADAEEASDEKKKDK